MKFLQDQIKTKKDINTYINNLVSNNILYHFDDDSRDIVNFENLSEDTLDLLNTRTNEMLELDYDYAFDYACEILDAE